MLTHFHMDGAFAASEVVGQTDPLPEFSNHWDHTIIANDLNLAAWNPFGKTQH